MKEDLGPVITAAQELHDFCSSHGWRFCFIGGLAIQRWGEPRFTLDADLTLLTGFGSEESFVDALLGRFRESRPQARATALRNRVLFLQGSNDVRLDVALAALPFEERSIERASLWQPLDGVALMTCSAEDLLVHKAYADRERDWGDIEGVLIRQRDRIDFNEVLRELAPFLELKDRHDIEVRLKTLARKCGVT